jgi:hypothetical protein
MGPPVDALDACDVPYPPGLVMRAGPGPRILGPPTVLDWFWKPQLPDAPPSRRRRSYTEQKTAYRDHLAGKPARRALARLDDLLPPASDA